MGNTLDFDPNTLSESEPTSKEKNDKEAKDNFLTLMGDYFGRNMKNIANVMKDSPTMGMMPGVAFMHAREGVTNAQDARNAYLRQELGEDNYDPGVNTIKDFLDDTETNAGLQFAYGFADNIDEVKKGLLGIVVDETTIVFLCDNTRALDARRDNMIAMELRK